MSWQVVARHDGRQTLGARPVRLLLYLLAAGVLLGAYVYPVMGTEPITTARFPGFVTGWLTTLVPVLGIVLGYNAVVGDRESGSLSLSLSLPISREDVVVGTFVGRAAVLTAAIVAVLLAAGALVVYPFGELELLRYLGFVALTVVYGSIWVGLGVAVSVSVATKQRAFVLGFGLVALFVVLWGSVEAALTIALDVRGVIDGSLPQPVQLLFDLDPGRLYDRLVVGFVEPSASVDGPWYRSRWAALVLYACWAVLPLGLATRRFTAGDLT